MHVLVLGPNMERLIPAFAKAGDSFEVCEVPLDRHEMGRPPHLIVSFGYRHIIREPWLTKYAGEMFNIHISYLPWNRGADPNFWSWFDDTPKGISIHRIDAGIDAGEITDRILVHLDPKETLRTSYAILMDAATRRFITLWPILRRGAPTIANMCEAGGINPGVVTETGSYHRTADKTRIWANMPLGWDTPCSVIAGWGAEERSERAGWQRRDADVWG